MMSHNHQLLFPGRKMSCCVAAVCVPETVKSLVSCQVLLGALMVTLA